MVAKLVTTMIAQLESESISLSVLSMARLMIAQWGNGWISLSPLFYRRVNESSMGKKTVSHYLSFSWPGFDFQPCMTDHSLPTYPEPGWQKMAQCLIFLSLSLEPACLWEENSSQSPVKGTKHPVDFELKGLSPAKDRQ